MARECKFSVGQLVTCDGPLNRGRDAQGWWRRVDTVLAVQWEPKRVGFKGRISGQYWRVFVKGYSGANENCFEPAPAGARDGDLIRDGKIVRLAAEEVTAIHRERDEYAGD